MMMCFYFMFICGLWTVTSKRKHLLVTLLSLEFIVLILFIILYKFVVMSELYVTMFFLSFAVCEGAMGLSILVSMIWTHGNDYFNSLGLLQCLYMSFL